MSRTETADVKSKSKIVGVAEFPQYDNVAECVDGQGEDTILALVNSQLKTNAMNTVRGSVTGKPSKTKLMQEAMGKISTDEFNAVVGDPVRLQALVAKKVAELEAEYASKAPDLGEDDDDDDDDD